jgi:hypothetical protein
VLVIRMKILILAIGALAVVCALPKGALGAPPEPHAGPPASAAPAPSPPSGAAAPPAATTASAVPASAAPSPSPTPAPRAAQRCDPTVLKAPAGRATLTSAEIESICSSAHGQALRVQLKDCGTELVGAFFTARASVCAAFPQIGASEDQDLVARVYRAVNGNLLAITVPSPQPSGIQPQGLAPTQAAVVAQALGSFLTTRAEQEVSAYAAVELFSRICASAVKGALPKTCALLEGQDKGAEPLGLGLLRRTMQQDLSDLPPNLLLAALGKAPTKADKAAICISDVGFALAKGLRVKGSVAALLTIDSTTKASVLQSYSAVKSKTEDCDATWKEITEVAKALNPQNVRTEDDLAVRMRASTVDTAVPAPKLAEVEVAVRELIAAVRWLQLAKTTEDLQAARAGVVASAVQTLKAIDSSTTPDLAPHGKLLDDLGALATAIWDQNWIEIVSAAANAETLGPILLCETHDNQDCKRDEKLRLILSIVGDVAVAKDSASVEDVLGRVAEPIGTWRRKFQDSLTFDLNGYVGAKYAYESVAGPAPAGSALAPVLAIGLELAVPYSKVGRLGIFAQVIDVGNVASVHFAGSDSSNLTTVETVPDVTWAQLFAPGAYLTWAPMKTPFLVGVGGDWVPVLRSTSAGPESVWHLGAMLAVDVPILELAHE